MSNKATKGCLGVPQPAQDWRAEGAALQQDPIPGGCGMVSE